MKGSKKCLSPPSVIEDRSLQQHSADKRAHVKRYQRVKRLGSGGFATVYEVKSHDSGRIYACKVINKQNLRKAEHKRKLLSEIKLHRTLNHKNIVKFERFFEDKEYVYILLECCNNLSLMQMLHRRKQLTETEVRFFMLQMLNAVDYLHSCHVIHRDLKLGNVLLDNNLCVKLCDFGLATQLQSSEERKTTICGTPNYIAPEILDGRRGGHSFEVDIWSVGVIMFTMLTGKPPFETRNVEATYHRIRQLKYEFPPHINISAEAKDLIASILVIQADQRPNIGQLRKHHFFTAPHLPIPIRLNRAILTNAPKFGDIVFAEPESPLDAPHPLQSLHDALPTAKPKHASSPAFHNDVLYPSHQRYATNDNPPTTAAVLQPIAPPNQNRNSHDSLNSVAFPNKQDESTDIDKKTTTTTTTATLPTTIATIATDIGDNITKTESDTESQPTPPDANNQCENNMSIWVCRWVDYAKKYGIGYLLSNEYTGVYFNDSTKMILDPKKQQVVYIYPHPNDSGGDEFEYHSIDACPPSLAKKVTLLRHFDAYLRNRQNSKTNPVHICSEMEPQMRYNNTFDKIIFVKKWIKTKHAILFRLSNKTVQINFMDDTQLVFSSVDRLVTYTDKNNDRNTFPLETVLRTNRKDLKKRMKYTQDVLRRLLTKQ